MTKDLSEILDSEIEALGVESTKHKQQFRVCQTLVIGLTGASSVVAAWALMQSEAPKGAYFAIAIITALATAISAWLEMRRSRDLWQHERPVYHALRDLRREFEFLESIGELSVEKEKEIFRRMTQTLNQSGRKWVQVVQKREPDVEEQLRGKPTESQAAQE